MGVCYSNKGVFILDPKWNLPETKFQSTIKEILLTLLYIAGEMKWMSIREWSEINDPWSKSQSFLFTHVYACVSFHLISFQVVFTWYFLTRNEISFLSKWPQWNNTRNEFHFGLYNVNSYKKLTRHRNQNFSLHPKWNLM